MTIGTIILLALFIVVYLVLLGKLIDRDCKSYENNADNSVEECEYCGGTGDIRLEMTEDSGIYSCPHCAGTGVRDE